jgi:hypothetical protein
MSNPIRTGWTPFKIPPTPTITSKSIGGKISPSDPYILSPMAGSNSAKNPSQFLEYDQIPINDILTRLDAIETRLDAATIDAECQGGNVVVTLNL